MHRAVFGVEGAPINQTGIKQAMLLNEELKKNGIHIETEAVAVSELLRTRQTAETAGFKNVRVNSILNEININDPELTLKLVAEAKLPKRAIDTAKTILANPPKEKIWITHGLVIAALLVELGVSDREHFIPDYCELREIEF